jgi:uncharacterized protein
MSVPPSTSNPSDDTRIDVIDALRGLAVLGILLIDITWFALPEYYAEAFRSDPSSANFWLRSFLVVFVEGKMRGLFGILFGAGILLFTIKKEAAGKPTFGLYVRRMLWLAAFGLIHAHILLWRFDVLFYYAVAGILLYPLRNINARWLLLVFVPVAMVIDVAQYQYRMGTYRAAHQQHMQAVTAQQQGKILTTAQTEAIGRWRGLERSLLPSRADAEDTTRKIKGTYSSAASRVRPIVRSWQTKLLPWLIWDSVGMMCLGMALFKTGFLSGALPKKVYAWIAFIGYAVGLPLALWRFHHEVFVVPSPAARLAFIDTGAIDWTRASLPFQRILIVLAHASIVILLFRSGVLKAWMRRMAAVGKMALTTYLSYTIICTLVFWGYGLNYYGELKYYQVYFVVLGIWTTILLFASIWLRYFRFGPLEWLWRTLTYMRLQRLNNSPDRLHSA